MISYGSGGCGGCVRYIKRAEQPLYDPKAEPRPKPSAVPSQALAAKQRCVPVVCVEEGRAFQSAHQAGSWLFSEGLTVNVRSAASAISHAVKSGKAAYGLHWRRADQATEGAASPALKPIGRRRRERVRPYRVAVLCVEAGELFPSIAKAAEWVKRQGRAMSSEVCIAVGISRAAANAKSVAYGFHWRQVDAKEARADG